MAEGRESRRYRNTSERFGISGCLQTLFLFFLFGVSLIVFIVVQSVHPGVEEDVAEQEVLSQEPIEPLIDTTVVWSLSDGFLRVLETRMLLCTAQVQCFVPISQCFREEGIVPSVMDVFTDVSLDLSTVLTVNVQAGVEPDRLHIEDYRISEEGIVEYMLISLPEPEIMACWIDHASAESFSREGHYRETAETVLAFIIQSDSSAIINAQLDAIEAGILEEATATACEEVQRLAGYLGVLDIQVYTRSAGVKEVDGEILANMGSLK